MVQDAARKALADSEVDGDADAGQHRRQRRRTVAEKSAAKRRREALERKHQEPQCTASAVVDAVVDGAWAFLQARWEVE
jgi:hypothetical protein